eukprot:m.201177 g.201177  ORF g.201177 m.201177 type:complete len:289 (+) comp21932_c1_seq2:215-1081(+)
MRGFSDCTMGCRRGCSGRPHTPPRAWACTRRCSTSTSPWLLCKLNFTELVLFVVCCTVVLLLCSFVVLLFCCLLMHISHQCFPRTHFGSPGIIAKLGIGMTAGGIGAVVGTPADLALIRMSADGAQPPELRRNYKNVFDALLRVTREEGVLGMWKGCGPTVGRALVVNAAQLACYSQAKEQLLALGTFGEGIGLHFAASMVSGLATTAASMPVDILKTRLQNMRVVNGVPQYKGAMDVFTQIVQKEGVFALWRGFLPYWSRLGPHTVITFVFMEQMYNTYQRLVLHNA